LRKVLCYGYRVNEVGLLLQTDLKHGFAITVNKGLCDPVKRPPVQRSLGCHVANAAMPHADPVDTPTLVAGVSKRIGARLPTPSIIKLRRLRRFVRRWLLKNLKPLSPDSDVSFETWLAKTHYPEWRKNELRVKWANMLDLNDHLKVKIHMKDEVYPEYKHARGIYAREDEFKCAVGPYFKLIEEALYQNPHFIKHIPVAERGRYVKERLYRLGAKYFATDYSTFEASFLAQIMEAVELELYKYMCQYLPTGPWFIALVIRVLMGKNICEHKLFWLQVLATRMSGEMNTSLGNGFTNLMIFLFLCEENCCTDVEGVVEGDDGLFTCHGPPPTSEQFAELGFVIKMEEHLELSHASFCGLVFDLDDEVVVTDPIETLVQFGWVTRQYSHCGQKTLMKLLRCKALSLAHQYPGCPIISALAMYGMKVSRSYCVRDFVKRAKMCMWDREQLIAAVRDERSLIDKVCVPKIGTRLLVESKYGVTVEHQILIEKYLGSLSSLVELNCPYIELYVKPVWNHYFRNYAVVNGPVALSWRGRPTQQECDLYPLFPVSYIPS